MKWKINADNYQVWPDFTIDITKDITLRTNSQYHLIGNNGSGKSSFIKKVLIPLLQNNPEQQYILYVEQQTQSQFDAVKAYAALQKPPVEVNTFSDMIVALFADLKHQLALSDRPCTIILDECQLTDNIIKELALLKASQYCLFFITHQEGDLGFDATIHHLKLNSINQRLSII